MHTMDEKTLHFVGSHLSKTEQTPYNQGMPETPVFHLTPSYAHVVVNGVVHLIPNGDVRFPWIVQACLHHEFSMAHALLNEQPADSDETATQWALEVDGLPEDVYYDFQQACALACGQFQSDSRIENVVVRNDAGTPAYYLKRNPQ
jgi:hypothetical protein